MIRSWNPHTKIDPSGTNRAQYAREGSSSITVGLRLGMKREPRRTRSDATTFPPPRRRPRSRARRISPTGASEDADEGAGTARRRSSGTGAAPLRRKSATISLSRMGVGGATRRNSYRGSGEGSWVSRERSCTRRTGSPVVGWRARTATPRRTSGAEPEHRGLYSIIDIDVVAVARGSDEEPDARSEPAPASAAVSSPSFPSGATRPSTVSSSTASSSPPRRAEDGRRSCALGDRGCA